jgi:hypothetical protein
MSPVREAKSRTLSREYMADRAFMTEYTPAEREWYLLTALFADDAGYLLWDLPDNAANLYRYESPARREKRVLGYVARFAASGRFQDLGCGHALMPSVGKHPRGSSREYAVRVEHQQCTGSAPEVQSSACLSSPERSSPERSSPGANDSKKGPTTDKTTDDAAGFAAAYAALLASADTKTTTGATTL